MGLHHLVYEVVDNFHRRSGSRDSAPKVHAIIHIDNSVPVIDNGPRHPDRDDGEGRKAGGWRSF
jgi:DNA gyrase/topoisomerase IV subunit B